ncbi:hypothetical protein SAMD00019534_027880 [Acytostelium subglobosum LB1]|uniref:hypothetical protein n=1 Tax=Acytostelium subglobosum LB1 TaxID=1410327 RepID=UPI0006450E4A|nr:hypothetical protein SAMD00019534_027880 [Acytostelium subglobosum LB1]GAM19613.1 hypothetical protein SAMD00019534_027880 [Acytostelium subglobosum LB1]|eukprot:XP_012756375.1 hypothetical protein SAMD00019534_027880 [Acytostelium subglobosum LB1]
MKLILTILVVLALVAGFTQGKVSKGHLKTKNNWAFLDKFCFSNSGPGTLTFTGSSSQSIMLYLYDDQVGSFPTVYKSHMNCTERTTLGPHIYSMTPILDGKTPVSSYPEDDTRPHYWYVVAADCSSTNGMDLEYKLEFYNTGNIWKHQFSADDQGLEQMYLTYFWFFLVLAIFSCYCGYMLMRTHSYHPIVKLLTITVLLEFLSIFILLCHYGSYSHNGVGGPGARGVGEIIDLAAQLTFILLIILLAKGWAISRTNLDDKVIILGVMGVLSALYLIMFIWYKAGQDAASTVYMYDTVPGIILLVCRSLAMLWFMWCGYNTYMEENNPAKRQFYMFFGIAFVIWFISLPFICIVASAVDPWIRQRTVLAFYVTFNFIAMTGMSILLSPYKAGDFLSISTTASGEAGSLPYESI